MWGFSQIFQNWWKLKNIQNGLLKVQIKEEELFIVPQVTLNFNLLNTLKDLYFNLIE